MQNKIGITRCFLRQEKEIFNLPFHYKSISEKIEQLKACIRAIQEKNSGDGTFTRRITNIQSIMDQRQLDCDRYDDSIVCQMVECIKVYHDGRIEIIFGGGYTVKGQHD